MAFRFVFCLFAITVARTVAQPGAGYTHEELQTLTKFRQQHRQAPDTLCMARVHADQHPVARRSVIFLALERRTLDGRLCAAAFVQNRQVYTGCADVPNPDGVSGRPWCYVESQVHVLLVHGHNLGMRADSYVTAVVGRRRSRCVGILWCCVVQQSSVPEVVTVIRVCVCGSSAPVANYDAARAVAKRVLAAKAQEVQSYTARLHKAQQAAENALDM